MFSQSDLIRQERFSWKAVIKTEAPSNITPTLAPRRGWGFQKCKKELFARLAWNLQQLFARKFHSIPIRSAVSGPAPPLAGTPSCTFRRIPFVLHKQLEHVQMFRRVPSVRPWRTMKCLIYDFQRTAITAAAASPSCVMEPYLFINTYACKSDIPCNLMSAREWGFGRFCQLGYGIPGSPRWTARSIHGGGGHYLNDLFTETSCCCDLQTSSFKKKKKKKTGESRLVFKQTSVCSWKMI